MRNPVTATVPTVWAVGPWARNRRMNTRSTPTPRAAPATIASNRAIGIGTWACTIEYMRYAGSMAIAPCARFKTLDARYMTEMPKAKIAYAPMSGIERSA